MRLEMGLTTVGQSSEGSGAGYPGSREDGPGFFSRSPGRGGEYQISRKSSLRPFSQPLSNLREFRELA